MDAEIGLLVEAVRRRTLGILRYAGRERGWLSVESGEGDTAESEAVLGVFDETDGLGGEFLGDDGGMFRISLSLGVEVFEVSSF